MALSQDIALRHFKGFLKRQKEIPGEGLMSARQQILDYIRFAQENIVEAKGKGDLEEIWKNLQAADTWLIVTVEVLTS